jgi:hypothetical protein
MLNTVLIAVVLTETGKIGKVGKVGVAPTFEKGWIGTL